MMNGSKMHLKQKLEADDDSFSDGSEFELSDNVGKEADQDSGMEEEYLRRGENTPLQKDPNYAGNRAWTTRGSNVPMVLQLNDTLDANNRMGHSDREEIEDKKSITALAPYSTNIVAEEGVVDSNSVEGSNVKVRSLVDDIFEEDKWKVDELLQAVDSHIVAEEEIPADNGAMVDNSLEAKAVLHKEATESVHVESSGSSNSVDAPPVKMGMIKVNVWQVKLLLLRMKQYWKKKMKKKPLSSGIVDETNDVSDESIADDLKASKIPLKVIDDVESIPSKLSTQTDSIKASEGLSSAQSEVSNGINENALLKTNKESLENLDSKSLSDNQTNDLKLDDTQAIEKELLFSTERNEVAETKEEKIPENAMAPAESVEEPTIKPSEPAEPKFTKSEIELKNEQFPKDHLRDDDQIELDSEVIGKDQSGDAMDLEKSEELGNASVEINAQDEAAKINGFDAVAEENARGDHVIGDTSTRDVVEDGGDESKNLDIDESEKDSAIDQVEVEETIAPEDNGNIESAESTIVNDEIKAADEHEMVMENQNGDKVMNAEDHDNLDVDDRHSAKEEDEIDDHIADVNDVNDVDDVDDVDDVRGCR